jgi:hypothetical protein
MMSCIAFKALRLRSDGLYSSQRGNKWDKIYAPSLGRLTYGLSAPSLKGKQGIYAATVYEAWRYMDAGHGVFLVAPDPDAETELGTHGWRTTCAYVIGEVTSLREAARLIVASSAAGYPQIGEILRWARCMLSLPACSAQELVARSAEVQQLIRAVAWVTWNAQIFVVAGDKPPVLVAKPCVASTSRIEVGEEWPPLKSLCHFE